MTSWWLVMWYVTVPSGYVGESKRPAKKSNFLQKSTKHLKILPPPLRTSSHVVIQQIRQPYLSTNKYSKKNFLIKEATLHSEWKLMFVILMLFFMFNNPVCIVCSSINLYLYLFLYCACKNNVRECLNGIFVKRYVD